MHNEQFRDLLEKRAEEARQKTNKELSGDIARLSKLTEREVDRLLPTKADRVAFLKLREILLAETEEAKKQTALLENGQELGGVILRVFDLFF